MIRASARIAIDGQALRSRTSPGSVMGEMHSTVKSIDPPNLRLIPRTCFPPASCFGLSMVAGLLLALWRR